MKPIALIMLIAGLALGGLGTYAALEVGRPDQQSELDKLKLQIANLEQDKARLQKLIAQEKKKNSELVVSEIEAKAAAEALKEEPEKVVRATGASQDPLAGIAEMLSDEDKAREGIATIMEGMGKSMRSRMISGRVRQFTDKLVLDEQQQEVISKLMDERGAAFQDLMTKRMRGQATDEDYASFAEFGSFGDQIREHLDADQREMYDQMQAEERARTVEQTMRREMRSLSRIPDLSEEQAVEVEAILAEQIEQETPMDSSDNFERMVTTREEDMAEMQQARLDALEPVLTADQLDAYRGSMERQRRGFSRWTGGRNR